MQTRLVVRRTSVGSPSLRSPVLSIVSLQSRSNEADHTAGRSKNKAGKQQPRFGIEFCVKPPPDSAEYQDRYRELNSDSEQTAEIG
jgi:hypothetical protein